jgi:hypothetical protein
MTLCGLNNDSVMAGLVPAIHVLDRCNEQDVDARHKAGHDDLCVCRTCVAHTP